MGILEPLPQDPAYHSFADARAFLGVPNFADVASSLAFVLVGLAGVMLLSRAATNRFVTPDEGRAYWWCFCAVAFAGIGSAYYHLAPDDARLAWDRLPIAIAFMWLLGAVMAERLGIAASAGVLTVLAVIGAGSVLYWSAVDDLRPYILVQFGSLAAIVVLSAWLPSRYSHGWVIFAVAALYGLAKWCELRDPLIYELTGRTVSGHTLKHLIAAGAAAVLLCWLAFRQPAAPT
jgi:hypothetical protein